MIELGVNVNGKSDFNMTLLQYAVGFGASKEVCAVLVEAGADTKFVNDSGQNILHVYLAQTKNKSRLADIETMIAIGINVCHEDNFGVTSL